MLAQGLTPQLISCDESGYTGPNLLSVSQPVFAYAAHTLSVAQAVDLINKVRKQRRPPIQAVELKASKLRERGDWPAIAAEILEATDGRFLFIVMDKRLALAANAYEYIIEPVVEENNALFYRFGLHRLVAAAVHRTILRADGPAEAIANELERFMRTFDPMDAPHLFRSDPALPADAEVLGALLRFARGYRARIEANTEHLRRPSQIGKWVLDLTSTSLTALLADGFGKQFSSVEVLCDESKPLLAMADFFEIWVGRNEFVPIHADNRIVQWRLNLTKPLVFGRSVDHPTLQIADVLAGLAAEIYGAPHVSPTSNLKNIMDRHLHASHMLKSQDEYFGLNEPMVHINMTVLRKLVRRAELDEDPLSGMEDAYSDAARQYYRQARRGRSPRRQQRPR